MKLKGILAGEPGEGKTTAALSLGDGVFFLSLESGDSSLKNSNPPFTGVIKHAKSVDQFMDYLTLIFGHRAVRPAGTYLSKDHHDRVVKAFQQKTGHASFAEAFPHVKTIYIDSLTELSRLLLEKANINEENWTEKGAKDGFAVYQEVIDAVLEVQVLIRDQQVYDVVQVMLLRPKTITIDQGRAKKTKQLWDIAVDGQSLRQQLPAFQDFVLLITKKMQRRDGTPLAKDGKGRPVPVIATEPLPEYEGYQIKYRSGDLNKFEPAHLGRLLEKMRAGAPREIVYADVIEE